MQKPSLPSREVFTTPKALPARKFLRLFIAIFTVVTSFYIVFSIWVNTHGRFGDYGMFRGVNDRMLKSHYLHQLPTSQLPDAFILGSSNTLPFKTEDFDKIFNVNSFNLGVFFGKAHEFYAYLAYLINERGVRPKVVFIGIDPWTFTPQIDGGKALPHLSKEVANAPILSAHLPEFTTYKLWLSNFSSIFSWLSIEHTLRSVLEYAMQRKSRYDSWHRSYTLTGNFKSYIEENPPRYWSDEVHEYYSYLDQENMLSQPWEEKRLQLVKNTLMPSKIIRNYIPNELFSAYNTSLFEQMVTLLKKHDIPTIMTYLPAHPYLQDVLQYNINYATKYSQVKNFVNQATKNSTNITVYDASDVTNFGGTASAFRDNNHMTPENTRYLMQTIKTTLPVNWIKP